MYRLLDRMRVVEASSFVASPTCGMYLAQMGAEVIRFDQIGGGPDFRRWPRAKNGASLYWESLNKGKKSIAINLASAEGRALAITLITAPGPTGGLFVTNYPVEGFLSHERLSALRPDLVTLRIMGRADGGPALDHTVNCAVGFPQITGPSGLGDAVVNHVLPAWDLLTGAYSAFAFLAAERHRRDTGAGQEVRVPLADMAIASVANLGMLAEVLDSDANRPRLGNQIFGAFGRDFTTTDGHRLMLMALTVRQWQGLVEALGIAQGVAQIEAGQGVSFARDEGIRFEHRDKLVPLVEEAVAKRTLADLACAFEPLGVCWSPYQSMREAADDPDLVRANPIFTEVEQPSGARYPIPGAPATIPKAERLPPARAPRLGEHTDEILANVLGLSSGEVGKLHDSGIVAAG
ncbi:carnitine dehydratase [Sphingobium sp. AR-3-1]|uniref:Carnitine dehydratase n=1 Tax=Sphingobium psychrophilum TaxID=2728834 RepID=A0A7X9X0D6_9SPHN|nr:MULTISPECIES: CoA transferase [Sphingobium]NML13157.1 carnitine dehydratase [Sphingobium psychrophilum]